MFHLVQLNNGSERRVAVVHESQLICLRNVTSVYELGKLCLDHKVTLSAYAQSLATGEILDYDAIYIGRSPWRLLAPFDVPETPSRMLVSGTGLTHLGSAKDRQEMHAVQAGDAVGTMTDSMRMFQWGLKGGRPAPGSIGTAPEWFYKGNGSVILPPFAPLTIPSYAEDGGEEAELAGAYIIGDQGDPIRIGMMVGNEFSDHKFEKRNYLNLAGSKLRSCSLGPELVVAAQFHSVTGEVRIERNGETLWEKEIATGEANMCHSLENLEHHHFKFDGHRQPGDAHVHFYGAQSLSFGDGVELRDGDWVEIHYEGFGRALRNPIQLRAQQSDRLVQAQPLT